MRRYLVVANRTLGGENLMNKLKECVAEGPCALHILVPATADPQGWTFDEGSSQQRAAKRLAQAIERFQVLGAEIDGSVGDESPVEAVLDAVRRDTYDEIIFSTLPSGASRWLRLDPVSRLQRVVDIPVSHVVSEDTSVGSS